VARIPCRTAAFTLIEVLVATLVLVVAIFGLVATLSYTMRQEADTREVSVAMNFLRAKVEEVRSQPFDDIFTYYSQGANRNFEVPGLDPQAGDPDPFAPHRVGEVIVGVINPRLLRVTVRASWTGLMGERTLDLETQVTDRTKEGF